jgi:hypothetical protein
MSNCPSFVLSILMRQPLAKLQLLMN